jgi:hypothetical protein
MKKMKLVNLLDLKPSPLRRSQLPLDLEQRARAVYGRLGAEGTLIPTFEQFELDFCRDAHPEREIAIWETMATVLEKSLEQFPRANRREAMTIILFLSVGKSAPKRYRRVEKLWKAENGTRCTLMRIRRRN